MLARVVDFGIAITLLGGLILLLQADVLVSGLFLLPVIFLIQCALILGIGVGAAAANVFYRDVDPLLKLAVQIWFYASPVLYPVSRVPEDLRWLYFLNPMAGIIASYRDILLYGRWPGEYLLLSAVIAVLVLVAGFTFFRRVEFKFADII